MKTTWLLILIIVSVTQLKAQQLIQPLKPGKTPDNSLYQYFRIKPDNNLFNIAPVRPKTNQPQTTVVPTVKEIMTPEMDDNMPIAKLRSDDKMPVVKPGDPNTRYTILIQSYGKAKPDSASRRP
jgi:hypothetical protein